ncbi:MAG: hypothetical protein C0514_00400 [Candidatus Puniceispirillum sp.]|nr:hypothetical protein [Candidatus Puniceispirillum sp.]
MVGMMIISGLHMCYGSACADDDAPVQGARTSYYHPVRTNDALQLLSVVLKGERYWQENQLHAQDIQDSLSTFFLSGELAFDPHKMVQKEKVRRHASPKEQTILSQLVERLVTHEDTRIALFQNIVSPPCMDRAFDMPARLRKTSLNYDEVTLSLVDAVLCAGTNVLRDAYTSKKAMTPEDGLSYILIALRASHATIVGTIALGASS